MRAKASLEQVLFHVVDRIDLHSFFVESLYEISERFVFFMDNSLQGCHCLWVSTRGGEVFAELLRQIPPRGDG
ncbi:hypothetical protein A2U01_0077621, partial [Trifolium medium]|nr:hypothetical protein [Trifolium medium]